MTQEIKRFTGQINMMYPVSFIHNRFISGLKSKCLDVIHNTAASGCKKNHYLSYFWEHSDD